jgi:hypothetical protein
MTLDDALRLAGQVLADYEASGPESVPGTGQGWAGRLAGALRDLTVSSAAWSAAPGPGPSAEALNAAARQIATGVMRIEAEANRIDLAATRLAAGRAAGPRHRAQRGDMLARLGWPRHAPRRAAAPGTVLLSADEAVTAWLAAGDAAAWQARYGDCADCVETGVCADPARHQAMTTRYAALRQRLRAASLGGAS